MIVRRRHCVRALLDDKAIFSGWLQRWLSCVCVRLGDKVIFPSWLQRLLLCACAISHYDIEMCAISTLLDLIVLTQSVLATPQQPLHFSDQLTTTSTTIRVIICSLLSPNDLVNLNALTDLYQVWHFF